MIEQRFNRLCKALEIQTGSENQEGLIERVIELGNKYLQEDKIMIIGDRLEKYQVNRFNDRLEQLLEEDEIGTIEKIVEHGQHLIKFLKDEEDRKKTIELKRLSQIKGN